MDARAISSALCAVFLASVAASATPLHLRVLDESGAGFPDVLVIVKSLEGRGELFRALTDTSGAVAERDLAPGLYRIIATCPYGICQTKVSEFWVGSAAVKLELTVALEPTRGNRVTIDPLEPITIQVVDAGGAPVASAELLVRDLDAKNERWYTTNREGEVKANLPTGTVTVVVLHQGVVTEETLSSASVEKLRADGKKLSVRLSVRR